MNIHYTAKFDGRDFTHHGEFSLDANPEIVQKNIDKVSGFAVGKLKEKCTEKFEVDFQTLTFFEVYYFENEEEVTIFKKQKE